MGVCNIYQIPNILEILNDFKLKMNKLNDYEFDSFDGMLSDIDLYLSNSTNYINQYTEAENIFEVCKKLFNKIHNYSNVDTTGFLIIYLELVLELKNKLEYVIELCEEIKDAIKTQREQY
jgi:hypothetical protein